MNQIAPPPTFAAIKKNIISWVLSISENYQRHYYMYAIFTTEKGSRLPDHIQLVIIKV